MICNPVIAGANTDDATAAAADIISGKTAYIKGRKVTGTITNQGAKTASLKAGGSFTIPKGFHNGSGKVTANSLASQTSATATAGDIVSDKTAWVNGTKITGTLNVPSLVLVGTAVKYGSSSETISHNSAMEDISFSIDFTNSIDEAYIIIGDGWVALARRAGRDGSTWMDKESLKGFVITSGETNASIKPSTEYPVYRVV